MFLLVIDEATRYKWVFLLEKKSEATHYIIMLLNELRTQCNKYQVQRLFSDKGGEFEGNELRVLCEKEGVILRSTNAYSPQENGIAERANGVVIPRIRALLTATHMTDLLWGEVLLHVVATLNALPTKPLGFESPHEKLYEVLPDLSVLRTWGCLAWVRIAPESRQRKEKLKPRARLSLLLGYSDSTKGYKCLDLVTCQVHTAQGGNARFQERFAANGDYDKHLLENAYLAGAHQLPTTVPVERAKTTRGTYLAVEADVVSSRLELLDVNGTPVEAVREPHGTSAAVGTAPESSGRIERSSGSASSRSSASGISDVCFPAQPAAVAAPAQTTSKPRKRRERERVEDSAKPTSGFAIQPPPMEPCLKRPRRTQKWNVRLLDYVVGQVQAVTETLTSRPHTSRRVPASIGRSGRQRCCLNYNH
ncbi:hypothetical protein PF005_g9560 [Phytophthora fragariae]|uniref:Integrase catalytic domain-containing protein n=1 Tax=Phytophthora fragariae TaxID=53985 RepID=A0A6A3TTS2_9STRA|nr:hypothetical protein PF003_g18406 [Phytophthora fragariae]KAE8944618.1 hypothetical protein PF009_g5715 [Phytophthora fragariae]KAE9006771.1 hypothetical protein PF011_g11425 [Phytophthora fragariae]KAE9107928.1 hypothetical protein PF010_g12098 [Phytophthora fragariae]KAE9120915.1 hypothetical protein PF007_g7997 [Phytophthora fragariae]